MVVVSSSVAVGPITQTLDERGAPIGQVGRLAQQAMHRLADDLAWWTSAAPRPARPEAAALLARAA